MQGNTGTASCADTWSGPKRSGQRTTMLRIPPFSTRGVRRRGELFAVGETRYATRVRNRARRFCLRDAEKEIGPSPSGEGTARAPCERLAVFMVLRPPALCARARRLLVFALDRGSARRRATGDRRLAAGPHRDASDRAAPRRTTH